MSVIDDSAGNRSLITGRGGKKRKNASRGSGGGCNERLKVFIRFSHPLITRCWLKSPLAIIRLITDLPGLHIYSQS